MAYSIEKGMNDFFKNKINRAINPVLYGSVSVNPSVSSLLK